MSKPLPRSTKPMKRVRKSMKSAKRSMRFEIINNAFRRYPDGREVCLFTLKGCQEYERRIDLMAVRQNYECCNGPHRIYGYDDSTFEHENGRGAGKRDDRTEIDGKPINGVSCLECNIKRGSKRTPIWHGPPEMRPNA